MDKYNLYARKSYATNIKIIRSKTSKNKNIIEKIKDKILHNANINSRLNMIRRVCDGTSHRDTILNHYSTRVLLQAYIMKRHPIAQPTIHFNLKCYDLCVLVLKLPKSDIKNETVEDLLQHCPTFAWEERIKEIYNGGEPVDHFDTVLSDLKNLCSFDIIHDYEFRNFTGDLRDKTKTIQEILILMHKEQKRWSEN